jgi:DNA-binding SARP family transcriptional activator
VDEGTSEELAVGVLGPLTARWAGGGIDVPGGTPAALLSWLVLHAPYPVPVSTTISGLWPTAGQVDARASLRSCASRLRRALQPAESAVSLVRYQGAVLALGCAVVTDAAEAERGWLDGLAALAARAPRRAVPLLEEAVGKWRGDVYPELRDTQSGLAEAVRLGELRADIDEALHAALLASGHDAVAVAGLRRAVHERPERDRAWQLLMVALAAGGQPAEALRVYQSCRAVRAEAGEVPSRSMVAVEQAILRQERLDLLTAAADLARSQRPAVADAFRGPVALVVGIVEGDERPSAAFDQLVARDRARRVVVDAAQYAGPADAPLEPLAAVLDAAFGAGAGPAVTLLRQWPMTAGGPDAADDLTVAAHRRRALRAVAALWEERATTPLALVIERVDRAHPLVAVLIRHLVNTADGMPLVVAVTAARHPRGPAAAAVRELLREALVVDLEEDRTGPASVPEVESPGRSST